MSLVLAIPVVVVLIVLYVIYDRRYHGRSASSLQATNEVFRDPSTGKRMRVYEDPRTGAREYVSEDD
ncbi:MAG TPA: hypothetical protein VH539_23840 [Gemmatimonadaceae bacterium]|jgi:hypothetical protein